MIGVLVLLPAVVGGFAFFVRDDQRRRLLLMSTALAHALAVGAT